MAGKQIIEHLRNISLFSACSTKDLQKIAKVSDELHVTAGTILVDQGQTGREAFVLMSGSATVKRNGKKIATVGEGDVIGELALLDRGPRTATVICDTDCEVLVIDQRHFLGVLDEVPALAIKLLGVLASKIRDFDRRSYG